MPAHIGSLRSVDTCWRPPAVGVDIGSLTYLIADNAKWRHEDQFPGSQVWADETERLLEFLVYRIQLERFLPRLRDDARARNSALAESRIAYFLAQWV
jgi:hypothetical protein